MVSWNVRRLVRRGWLACALVLLGCSTGGEGDHLDAGPSEPVLDALLVKGAAVGLKPAFAPDTRRYAVLAREPAETLSVTLRAAPDLALTIDGHKASDDVPVELAGVEPGSEIKVRVENALGERRTYALVYLPHDFPDITIRTHEPGASSDPIYVTPKVSDTFYIAKLNNDGVPLFYRKVARNVADFKKHPTGQYSYALETDKNEYWEQVVLDEHFDEITRVTSVGLANTDAHDFHILPNGNYIVLSYERTTRDLTALGRGADERVIDAILQEQSPDGEVLFEWNSSDHMSIEESVYHKSEADYSHINSIFVDKDGDWILSSRGMAQVLKIDRTSGEVRWRLGGMSNEFTFLDDPFGGLCGQHTATRIQNGNLLLFDNGQSCWPEVPERGELTRIVEYDIDEAKKTARLVSSYSRKGAYTISQGSVQRLDNGNNFIGWGIGTELLATEVDAEGHVVFELDAVMPGGPAWSYRAYRFAD